TCARCRGNVLRSAARMSARCRGNVLASAAWTSARCRGNLNRRRIRVNMRAFAWFLGSILLAGLIGACIAYPAYELTSSFATFAFHRVASRIFMLVLAVLLAMLCRHLNLKHRRDFGYGLPWRRFLKVCALWT